MAKRKWMYVLASVDKTDDLIYFAHVGPVEADDDAEAYLLGERMAEAVGLFKRLRGPANDYVVPCPN